MTGPVRAQPESICTRRIIYFELDYLFPPAWGREGFTLYILFYYQPNIASQREHGTKGQRETGVFGEQWGNRNFYFSLFTKRTGNGNYFWGVFDISFLGGAWEGKGGCLEMMGNGEWGVP